MKVSWCSFLFAKLFCYFDCIVCVCCWHVLCDGAGSARIVPCCMACAKVVDDDE